ncbi:MAG: hypothetical protein WC845_02895 [Candidatus Staskawiczbacteria bacterium]|jgi:hypothetical protein
MLSKVIGFVKRYRTDILLVIAVVLLILLAFSFGFIAANYCNQQPIEFIQQ